MKLYDKNALDCSRITATNYSTSFSLGIRLFKKKYRPAIYAIYGYVRFADEIVDTFHEQNKEELLNKLREDTWQAIHAGFSYNPIIHSFQKVVNTYKIDRQYIEAFLHSMEMDLHQKTFHPEELKIYIYGSAEVIGLMCLRVFYSNREEEFDDLIYPARKLGEAFQKVNFLRDIRADYHDKGRIYFPGINLENFSEEQKKKIEKDIAFDFSEAKTGISKLNPDVRLGVYLAYTYYLKLLEKIRKTTPREILHKRYRVSSTTKIILLFKAWSRYILKKI
ncbi:MAG: phytoene/squalene synthase family protein [Mariniphaga sp.]|nr:phytoene/squalene synthase family protein [Mariniphaga sp.]MDD4226370.1 phytoene/squalene synthase family protein [Mariniphaga sp.]